ncbi:hypothetical protein O9G_002642 [Rozella allomycis CSF55]|uniref:RGS domain-containing protein n=1 Tax=Rozella allomycis (strain CSF55) TaxID=988480 RepID=A0A075AZV3_ROZAC|nr:hypothetical protein O9G_002642 [Rozella allomycis CSF55]|eukprot:EPZ35634.1 hypothetical protein O9G_002642 [Rozella allomycis CSF55]
MATKVVVVGDTVRFSDIIENTLADPFDYDSFRKFAIKKCLAEESILYMEAFHKFKETPPGPDHVEMKKHIIHEFIKDNSPNELNIPHDLKKAASDASNDANDHVMEEIYEHIYRMLKTDIFPKFLSHTTVKKQLHLSTHDALWFLDLPGSLKTFFKFPDPVNEVEARIHGLCSSLLILAFVLMDLFVKGPPYILYYLTYGFAARSLCGSRLDVQAYFVLFVARPIFTDVLGLFETRFVGGFTRRLAQIVGLLFSLVSLILYQFNLVYACYGVLAFLFFATFLNGVWNICLVCECFRVMIGRGWISSKWCEECSIKYVETKKINDQIESSKQIRSGLSIAGK